jgi:hypothetical protein
VGVQLLLLAAEIGTLTPDPAHSTAGSLPAEAWQALIRVSAWLSLLAGGLVVLLLAVHRYGSRRLEPDSDRPGTDDLIEDITVRIYEFEGSGEPVEVNPQQPEPPLHLDRPHLAKSVLDSAEDESASILEQIEGLGGDTPAPPRPSWRAFLRRFGRGSGRS